MDIVLVAGLWLDASAWNDTVPHLTALGHRVHPVSLPGQGDGRTDATYAEQVAAVVAAVDAASGPVLVVGHSAACTLAWAAADARLDRVAKVALIGGFPSTDGTQYANFFPIVGKVMGFPGWEPFEGPDSADLDAETKARMARDAHPVPESVATATVTYANEARTTVPVVMICPEFSPEEARAWVDSGELPELAAAENVSYLDIDSGHWPMFSAPEALAEVISRSVDAV